MEDAVDHPRRDRGLGPIRRRSRLDRAGGRTQRVPHGRGQTADLQGSQLEPTRPSSRAPPAVRVASFLKSATASAAASANCRPVRLVSLARSTRARWRQKDVALCPECTNCLSQHLGARICGLLACLSIVDPAARAGCEQAQPRQHPHYGGVLPSTTPCRRYSSSVQLFRHRPARNEACSFKLAKG